MKFLYIIILIHTILTATTIKNVIPEQFHGNWVIDTKYCKKDHPYNLEITKTNLSYWESDGTITNIIINKKDEFSANIEMSAEGDKWLSFIHFSLSNDKKKLTDISTSNPNKQVVRYKCLLE